MKLTKKYVAAADAHNKIKNKRVVRWNSNAELYQLLESYGYWWDVDNGEWTNANNRQTAFLKLMTMNRRA